MPTVTLAELWLPILVSAVVVFIASSVIHMVLPIHKGDYRKVDNEDQLLETMRHLGVRPGTYMFPNASSMKECGSPEHQAKMKLGPVGHMTVIPSGPMAMGRPLLQWFLWSILVGVFAAYLGTLALQAGVPFAKVFRVTGTVALLGYAFSNVTDSIWKGVPWSITFKFVFDGIVYALLTAAVFGLFWPEA